MMLCEQVFYDLILAINNEILHLRPVRIIGVGAILVMVMILISSNFTGNPKYVKYYIGAIFLA